MDGVGMFSPQGSYTPSRDLFAVVFLDEFVSVEIPLIDPLIVRWRVAFPPHQVLDLSSSAEVAFSEDLFHLPFFFAFNDFGRRFDKVGTVFGGFLERG